jgi:8-oxo-dGTP pyrophosphatase MutT (NUDIX family)
MKLLLFIRDLSVGGSQLALLAVGLAQRGHDVAVAVLYADGALEPMLSDSGVRLLSIGKLSRWHVAAPLSRLRHLFISEHPDLVYAFLPTQCEADYTRFGGGRERHALPVGEDFAATGNAAAAILVLEDGRYLLQLRDDKPQIWYPGYWGLFGGAVDPGEDAFAALRRELMEELEIEVGEARLFASFDFDLQPMGLDHYNRKYYEVPVTLEAWRGAVLHEGAAVRALSGDTALSLPRISPYDAFALSLHHHRHRLDGSFYCSTPPE